MILDGERSAPNATVDGVLYCRPCLFDTVLPSSTVYSLSGGAQKARTSTRLPPPPRFPGEVPHPAAYAPELWRVRVVANHQSLPTAPAFQAGRVT